MNYKAAVRELEQIGATKPILVHKMINFFTTIEKSVVSFFFPIKWTHTSFSTCLYYKSFSVVFNKGVYLMSRGKHFDHKSKDKAQ